MNSSLSNINAGHNLRTAYNALWLPLGFLLHVTYSKNSFFWTNSENQSRGIRTVINSINWLSKQMLVAKDEWHQMMEMILRPDLSLTNHISQRRVPIFLMDELFSFVFSHFWDDRSNIFEGTQPSCGNHRTILKEGDLRRVKDWCHNAAQALNMNSETG